MSAARGESYFEDFPVGRRFTTGGATLSEAQILAFAWEWDPQPFHIDAEAAKGWGYGGLIASGFQTLLVAFRLIVQENVWVHCSLGSPGIEALRWLLPVRPGDTLHCRGEVLEARESGSKPDRGVVKFRYDVLNQKDETVADMVATQILRRRPAE
ncbi:MaoC family dehydratase [Algihabitans albus]|uniref:MaoC family dehydratase n=1 Tax=Algihabitans albus TaxID=2164067 RepID=UPI000E5D8A78|nr:MaoC family dehydratase [Algihabitans albus]